MLQILGRTSSINVRKVLWACDELGLPFARHVVGLGEGRGGLLQHSPKDAP